MFFNCSSFLAKRGVKEEIQTFDARKISPDIRESVEELLKKNRDSFEPKVFYISSEFLHNRLLIIELLIVNPYKPNVLFMGHRQTVQTRSDTA